VVSWDTSGSMHGRSSNVKLCAVRRHVSITSLIGTRWIARRCRGKLHKEIGNGKAYKSEFGLVRIVSASI
jgi:hypothetical protein